MNDARRQAWTWHTCDEFASSAGDLARLVADPSPALVVKATPHRAVYRASLAGTDCHVKLYRADRRERLRRWFRPSRGKAEFDLGVETRRRGVPTLDVLAWGECAITGDSAVVTRTALDAVSLLDCVETAVPALPPGPRSRARQQLAGLLGDFLARVHRAGVTHHDLHPGNVLLVPGEAGPRLLLIDLLAARLSRPLSWRASRDNAVVLNRWFALRTTRTDRRRMWQSYCRVRADLRLDERETARDVERRTRESLIKFATGQDDRCLGGNRHFRAFRTRQVIGHAVADVTPAEVESLLRLSPEDVTTLGDVLKVSSTSTVVSLHDTSRVIKTVPATRLTDPLASLFRPPSALHSYRMGHALRSRGLPTPRPLAVWHRRWGPALTDGYLLTDRLPDARHLFAFLAELRDGARPERRERLDRVIDDLAAVVRGLHDWKLSHRDMKAQNVLVSPRSHTLGQRGLTDLDAVPGLVRDRVWLIDLAGVRQYRTLTRARRVSDLGRLHASLMAHPDLSRGDRLRFLRTYLQWGLFGKAGWKEWWRAVAAWARAKAAAARRRGRVVG